MVYDNYLVFPLFLSQEVGARKDKMDFEEFYEIYNLIMFSDQKKVSEHCCFKKTLNVNFSACYCSINVIIHAIILQSQILEEFEFIKG